MKDDQPEKKAWWERKENRDLLTPEKYADTLVPLLQPLGLKAALPGILISLIDSLLPGEGGNG